MLNDLSKTLVPGIELSNAKAVEMLILDKNKSKCSLGSKPGGTHRRKQKRNLKNTPKRNQKVWLM